MDQGSSKRNFFGRFSKGWKNSASKRRPNAQPDTTDISRPPASRGTYPTAEQILDSPAPTVKHDSIPPNSPDPEQAGDARARFEPQGIDPSKEADVPRATPEPKTSRSIQELITALDDFRKNCQAFSLKNKQFVLIDAELEIAFGAAQGQENIQRASTAFSNCIWNVLRTVEEKRKLAKGKWTTKLGKALSKLYPIARLSLGVTAAVADVYLLLTH